MELPKLSENTFRTQGSPDYVKKINFNSASSTTEHSEVHRYYVQLMSVGLQPLQVQKSQTDHGEEGL